MNDLSVFDVLHDQEAYRLPTGVVGVLFGPPSHIDRGLWFITEGGSIRSATFDERIAFLSAFPHFQTTGRPAN